MNEQKQNKPKLYDENTLQQIRAIPILDVVSKLGYTPEKKGVCYALKEHDSLIMYPNTNSYYRFSTGKGGSNIDLYMELTGSDYTESVKALKNLNGIEPTAPTFEIQQKPKKEFEPPKPTENKYSRMFAYLSKTRCIDNMVINDLTKRKLMYQDERGNVIFSCLDNKQNMVGGIIRGTGTTPFKGQVPSSNIENGFFVNNEAKTLYVTEAPIDTLSIMTFKKAEKNKVKDYSYLALGGNNPEALTNTLKNNPNINKVVLCLDNDKAGQLIKQRLVQDVKKFDNINIKESIPKSKDFNEDLVKLKNASLNQLAQQKQIQNERQMNM